ncbi:16S rRNA (cytosine(967)-C(5))-methyltransferase [Williamsoniiplasma luminosum]|uniref:16S rRNA (cytosine(967)-C(5))-methyltransferase n=2 Tax=Williamsoniiplasma luminosum TaxID=214888 RepID=A0A2K8NT99_9MOLU|nr:16S rRNA (cytosine(967)-C(5))-methyltransferase [Williamsoniiplasma luminosum]
MMIKKTARYQAWEILVKVFQQKQYSNILLNNLAKSNLDVKSKNFIFALVHGTIKNKMFLDYLTKKLIDFRKTPINLQILLWMSLYQIHFMDRVQGYAITNEAVEIAKTFVEPKIAGVVNASLKKVLATPDFFTISFNDQEKELCLLHSFPFELFKQIKNDYGLEIATKIVQDSLQIPTISFRVNTLKIETNKFYEQYQDEYGLSHGIAKDGLIASKAIVNSPIYQNGLINIQDQASILVGEIADPKPNMNVLDMCSAPGGKLTHLAALMQDTKYLVGNEISVHKMHLIEENIQRLGIKNIILKNQDARKFDDQNFFDLILLDAPCSGFGVFKRKPEIKLNYNSIDTVSLVQLQKELLETAYFNLKNGGELVYSTCTINKAECSDQIQNFINQHQDMKIISEKQIFGFENNTDGFYICKLKKSDKIV